MNGFKEKFTLAQVLAKIGFLNIGKEDKDSIGDNYFKLKKQSKELKTQKTIGKGLRTDRNFEILFKNINSELRTFVFAFDNKAVMRSDTNIINVYLSDPKGLERNTNRIYRFLNGRTKRYERLVNYAPMISKILKQDGSTQQNIKLSLKIDSLKDIDKMSDLQYNRFLDDLIDNLQSNADLAQFNTQDKRGKVYDRKQGQYNNKRGL